MRFHLVEKTDTGKVRKRNEDSFGKHRNDLLDACLFCVADGMGGYGLGDVASKIVVDCIIKEFAETAEINIPVRKWISRLFDTAEGQLRVYREENNITRFGTTLAIVFFMKGKTICANVGDTRIYSLDANSMVQESHDHTLVNQLLESGQITVSEAKTHPNRHMLTLALTGERDHLEPYISIWPFDPVRTYLIASDGLYNMLNKAFIGRTLLDNSPQEAADILLNQTLENGATDNVTFQIIKPFGE
jgi:protein phosphatase